MPFRKEKIQELLHHEVALILQREFAVPGTLITVMGVKVSPDGLHANVFYSVIPAGARTDIERMFVREIYDIQQVINKKLRMHPVPKIRFVLDTTEAQASKIDEILRNPIVVKDLVEGYETPADSRSKETIADMDKKRKVRKDGRLSYKSHAPVKPKKSGRIRKSA